MTQMTPLPCNDEIFKKGVSVAQIAPADGMRSWHIDEFVQRVAQETQTQTDWHFSGGIAQVLTLGNATAVSAKIEALWPEFAAPYPNAMFAIGLPARCRHPVQLGQQIVWELDVGLVDLVDQKLGLMMKSRQTK